jgi:hypothetical protein
MINTIWLLLTTQGQTINTMLFVFPVKNVELSEQSHHIMMDTRSGTMIVNVHQMYTVTDRTDSLRD